MCLEQSNPQFVFIYEDAVYTVNSGLVSYDDNFVSSPVGLSGVDKFLLSSINTATAPDQNISIGDAQGFVGNPGGPAVVGDTVFLGSGTAPVIFQLNLKDGSVLRGTNDPIEVRPVGDVNALMVPFAGPDGRLYVADFNMDLLHVYDPATLATCGTPQGVGVSDEMLEGPLSLGWRNGQGLLLNSLSAAVVSFGVTAP